MKIKWVRGGARQVFAGEEKGLQGSLRSLSDEVVRSSVEKGREWQVVGPGGRSGFLRVQNPRSGSFGYEGGRAMVDVGVAKRRRNVLAVRNRLNEPTSKAAASRRGLRGGSSREESEGLVDLNPRPVANVAFRGFSGPFGRDRKSFVDVVKGPIGAVVGQTKQVDGKSKRAGGVFGRQRIPTGEWSTPRHFSKSCSMLLNRRDFFKKEGNPAVSFSLSEMQIGMKKFDNSLVLRFQQGRPPAGVLKRFISHSWKAKGHFSFSEVWDGDHVLVRFELERDLKAALEFPVRIVGAFVFLLFKWSVDYVPSSQQIREKVWISLPKLPVWLYDLEYAEVIVSSFAKFVKLDADSEGCLNLMRMRICIEVDKLKAIPEKIWIELPNGYSFWQDVQVDGLRANFCANKVLELSKEKTLGNEAGNKNGQEGSEAADKNPEKFEWQVVTHSKKKNSKGPEKQQGSQVCCLDKSSGSHSPRSVGQNEVSRISKGVVGIGESAEDSLKLIRKNKQFAKKVCHVANAGVPNTIIMDDNGARVRRKKETANIVVAVSAQRKGISSSQQQGGEDVSKKCGLYLNENAIKRHFIDDLEMWGSSADADYYQNIAHAAGPKWISRNLTAVDSDEEDDVVMETEDDEIVSGDSEKVGLKVPLQSGDSIKSSSPQLEGNRGIVNCAGSSKPYKNSFFNYDANTSDAEEEEGIFDVQNIVGVENVVEVRSGSKHCPALGV